MNERMNGDTPLNPQEAARYALVFLARAQFVAAERNAYDVAEALLRGLASGELATIQTDRQFDVTTGAEPHA